MDLIARKKLRDRKKREEELKKAVAEEVFRDQKKSYAPSAKKMTAITFVLFVLLVIYILLNSEIVLQDQCLLFTGLECKEPKFTADTISFEAHNILKEDLNVTLRIERCEKEVNKQIRRNEKALFEFKCPELERKVKRSIFVKYVGYSGLPHDTTGKVQGLNKAGG